MTYFMKDLETLGTAPGCVILSVGVIACDFHAETVDDLFLDQGKYVVLNTEDSLNSFLHIDQSTVQWWSKQGPEARQVLADARDLKKSVPLREGIQDTIDYVLGHCAAKEVRMLGNGADFDNPIFNVAAQMAGLKTPWSYGGRCYRTLKNLDELLGPKFTAPKVERHGTYHNALDDAKTQALHLWEHLQNIRSL